MEVSESFFCEGAWSGDYASGDFARTFFFGSGARLTDDHLLFSSPNHTLERIFALRDRDLMIVSNSYVFVFAQANDEPDPHYLLYRSDLASVIDGLDSYVRSIPTKRGNRIHMFCHCNVSVGADLQVVETPKLPVRDFSDFADYKSFLEEHVRALADNATDPRRRTHYLPIATISSGYDSPASAVIARAAGCGEAVTFGHARPDTSSSDTNDSGAPIARSLGIKVTVFDRLDYLKCAGFPEAETGISEWPCLGDALERRLLFTGFNDLIWDPYCKTVGPFINRSYPAAPV